MPSDPPELPPGFQPFRGRKLAKKAPAKKAVKKAAPAKAGPAKPPRKVAAKKAPRKANNPHIAPVAEDVPVKAVRKRAPAKKVAKKVAGLSLVPPPPPQSTEQALDALIAAAIAQGDVMDPALEAYNLRQSGRTWPEIARRTGYVTVSECGDAVLLYIQQVAVNRSDELRAMAFEFEMGRLDALTAAVWDSAMEGDLDAAKFCLSVSTQRGRWHGWEREVKVQDNRTIIISGGQSMAEEMRAAAVAMHPHLVIDGSPVEG